jgi:hypothetical protein
MSILFLEQGVQSHVRTPSQGEVFTIALAQRPNQSIPAFLANAAVSITATVVKAKITFLPCHAIP